MMQTFSMSIKAIRSREISVRGESSVIKFQDKCVFKAIYYMGFLSAGRKSQRFMSPADILFYHNLSHDPCTPHRDPHQNHGACRKG
jgi:hypothetical protein